MRLTLFLFALLAPGLATPQRWEKPLVPGVVYRMEVDGNVPRVVHALRFARGAATVTARPQLARPQVFAGEDEAKGRAPLSQTVQRTGALAGVNADFFPWSGDPLGAMVRDGELVSRPFRGRSVFAWGPGGTTVSRLNWTAEAVLPDGTSLSVDGLNEEVGRTMLVLTTPTGGNAVSAADSVTAYLAVDGPLTPKGSWVGKVVSVEENLRRAPVGKGQFALTASGPKAEALRKLEGGQSVTVRVAVTGLEWEKWPQVVGGGPVIVAGGKPIQAWTAEDFRDDFATRRHPRTAIGATPSGDVWLVVVEGRQSHSAGATLDELGRLMLRLGCTEAINLDGGGSSQIALRGMVVNRPSDGSERPIANSVLIAPTGEGWPPRGDEFVVKGSARVTVGSAAEYQVVDESGRTVPNAVVVWAASGDAWIDQGGRLRGLRPGRSKVTAWVNGRTAEVTVTVEARKPATAPNQG